MSSRKKSNARAKKKNNIALLIDLDTVRDLQTIVKMYELAYTRGEIIYSCVYAEEKDLTLISTISGEIEKKGAEIKVTVGPSEITMALDIVEFSYKDKIDTIIACTRKNTLIPAFIETKRLGKKLIIMAPISAPANLQDVADEIEVV